ncbi:MAG: hypothetical protein M3546_04885 [Actinomycetota bacterium]|nr:hypothetical protein [Actinomycetota bacterium]
MLTAVPLPDRPLTVLWQSTLVDIEPGTRYGYRHDAAAINTTLAVLNDTGAPLEFPLILATTDPENRSGSHRAIRVGNDQPVLEEVEVDAEWETMAAALRANAVGLGHDQAWVDQYLEQLRKTIRRAYRSEPIRLEPGQERFIRTHQRKLLAEQNGAFEFRGVFPLPQFVLARGGTISVAVALPRSTQKFSVDLLDWTRNFSPQAFGKDPGLPLVGGRFLVSWFWQNDPELFVSYRYGG